MYVIKRSGKKEKLKIEKFKKQIEFSVKNTKINPIDFENAIYVNFVDGIRTTDLQTTIFTTAEKKADKTNTEWLKVAGRACMWNLYGNIYKNTGFDINDWYNHIKYLTEKGYYKKEVLEKLDMFGITTDDIDYNTIRHISDDNNDFHVVISTARSYENRYILKNKDGNHIEYPFIMHIANAALLAKSREKFFSYYKKLSEQALSLATSFLSKLRIPNGNTGSCYIGTNINSLTGLTKSWEDMSFISKEGGGIGWYVGFLSVSGAKHSKVIKANVKTKWHKIINDIAIAVDQGGIRKAGISVADDWWQKDILSFLEMKAENNGDVREKSFDIFPQVVLDNYFIDKVDNCEDVFLFDHYEFKKKTGIVIQNLIDDELYQAHLKVDEMCRNGELTNWIRYNAQDLWEKILTAWLEIGGFYITHKDNLNISNYIKNDKENANITHCANLCIESFSITKPALNWKEEVINGKRHMLETDGLYHSCNLISINVADLVNKDDEYIYDICDSAVRMLTTSIDLGTNPSLEGKRTSKLLQNIGIGTIGFPDYMAYNKVLYDTEEGIRVGMALQEKLAYFCYKASVELAKETQPYPWFKPENYDKLFGKTIEELNKLSAFTGNNYDWYGLREDIRIHGIANFYLMATAPNTSTGLLLGVGSSYLPVYGKFNYEETMNMIVPVAGKYLEERYWYYKTRYQYNPIDIVKFTMALQEFIDTGISMELNLDTEITDIFELSETFLKGFKKGKLKGIYYNTSATECSDCKN